MTNNMHLVLCIACPFILIGRHIAFEFYDYELYLSGNIWQTLPQTAKKHVEKLFAVTYHAYTSLHSRPFSISESRDAICLSFGMIFKGLDSRTCPGRGCFITEANPSICLLILPYIGKWCLSASVFSLEY